MVKMNVKKMMLTMALIGVCACVPKATVQAASTTFKESEPNNSIGESEVITANNEKPEGTLGDGAFIVNGYTASTDVDYFKVYLKTGENYMTCNGSTGKSYSFEISNELGKVLLREEYIKTAYGVTGYQFKVEAAGYYYVKILGTTTSSNSYLFCIGSPVYSTADCKMTNGSITLQAAGQTRNISYNFTNDTSIPTGAIARDIIINGVRTNDVKSIQIRNAEKSSIVTLDTFIWSKRKINSLKLPMHTTWNATFAYNKQVTITPEIQIYYVYPVLGQELP